MNHQTIIDDYLVELDTDMEGHGANHPDRVTGCWISRSLILGTHSASLACLIETGVLSCYGRQHSSQVPVAQQTIDQIESWALGHGY